MSRFVMGHYFPGDSYLHRMDPRAKFLFVFGYMIIVFLANNFPSYLVFIVFTGLGVWISKIQLRLFLQTIKPVFLIILLTSILHLFFTKGGEILIQLPYVTIYEEGLRQAIFISFRFLLLVSMASLLTFTTSPIDLTDGLESLFSPLKRWKFPAHELALMMSIALRFIPTLWEETEKIAKAQMARGANLEEGNIINRLKSYIPVFIPLFISAFRRAEDLAMAMESRGYRGGEGRTKLRVLKFTKLDYILALLFLALVVMVWLVRK